MCTSMTAIGSARIRKAVVAGLDTASLRDVTARALLCAHWDQ